LESSQQKQGDATAKFGGRDIDMFTNDEVNSSTLHRNGARMGGNEMIQSVTDLREDTTGED
jgi:hypothetical protein